MDDQLLAELADWYEEYLHGDPKLPSTKQAAGLFNLKVKKLYSELPENQRTATTLDQYRNGEVIPEVDAYLNKRQTKFPALVPEKVIGNKKK